MKTTSKAVNRPNSTILKSVTKPGRYAGGEYGQIIKDKTRVKARFAFCFPDTYEIGMSNLGVRLLYGALNQHPDIWCERVYDPWVDMQEQMKLHDLPLVALERRLRFRRLHAPVRNELHERAEYARSCGHSAQNP